MHLRPTVFAAIRVEYKGTGITAICSLKNLQRCTCFVICIPECYTQPDVTSQPYSVQLSNALLHTGNHKHSPAEGANEPKLTAAAVCTLTTAYQIKHI